MALPDEVTPAAFPAQSPPDRSAAGLQSQRWQGGLRASGQALGVGRQMVFAAQFRNPPVAGNPTNLSGAQFGNGEYARTGLGTGNDQEGED